MRTSRHLVVGALLASLWSAGCGDPTSPGNDPASLAANRQKWASHGFVNYSFTVRALCFCAINDPVRVLVVNDSVVAAYKLTDGTSLDPRFVQTIGGLFDFISRGFDAHAAVLTVEYDAALGYPRHIVYDGAANIADDEVTYDVSDVAVITQDPL